MACGNKGFELQGRRFGRLVAREVLHRAGRRMWLCDCDCGAEAIVASTALIARSTKSCGCLQRERRVERQGPTFAPSVVTQEREALVLMMALLCVSLSRHGVGRRLARCPGAAWRLLRALHRRRLLRRVSRGTPGAALVSRAARYALAPRGARWLRDFATGEIEVPSSWRALLGLREQARARLEDARARMRWLGREMRRAA